jgi:CRP/FNR family transcriptional regulator, cyclic AMP receptor protein
MAHIRRDERIDLLSKVWLFSNCSMKELDRIAGLTTPMNVAPGKVLAREGEGGSEFFVVVEGTAVAKINDELVGTLSPGSFFGELALLDRGPRTATVTASTAMTVLVLSRPEFHELIVDAIPSVTRKMISVLGARLRQADQRATRELTNV